MHTTYTTSWLFEYCFYSWSVCLCAKNNQSNNNNNNNNNNDFKKDSRSTDYALSRCCFVGSSSNNNNNNNSPLRSGERERERERNIYLSWGLWCCCLSICGVHASEQHWLLPPPGKAKDSGEISVLLLLLRGRRRCCWQKEHNRRLWVVLIARREQAPGGVGCVVLGRACCYFCFCYNVDLGGNEEERSLTRAKQDKRGDRGRRKEKQGNKEGYVLNHTTLHGDVIF